MKGFYHTEGAGRLNAPHMLHAWYDQRGFFPASAVAKALARQAGGNHGPRGFAGKANDCAQRVGSRGAAEYIRAPGLQACRGRFPSMFSHRRFGALRSVGYGRMAARDRKVWAYIGGCE